MTVGQLEQYISEEYTADGEHLWAKYPTYEVFRHIGSKKWFAIFMDVPEDKMRASTAAPPKRLNILNVKCDSVLMGSLLREDGFYPAYHMNKDTWISIDIAQADDETIKLLLDKSYELTRTPKDLH